MKVKIFDCDYASELERKINDFIEEIKKEHMEVKDIKYSTPHDGDMYSFSALVMYVPDGKIYLDIDINDVLHEGLYTHE